MRTKLSNITALVGSIAIVGTLAGTIASTSVAHADDNDSPLASQPAVRHRLLLVKNRFELAPLFESTINADFRHVVGGGAKLEYHLTDMFSIGVIGVFSTSIDTGLVKKIRPTLETADPEPANPSGGTREPSQTEFDAHLNSMPVHGAAFLSVTPWYGKLAAFGKAFVNFDFYFQGGVALAQPKPNCPKTVCSDIAPGQSRPGPDDGNPETDDTLPPDDNPNNDAPLNDGNRVGLYLGGGMHVFFTDFIALDLTIRDYAFSDNPSGADFNADLYVDKADSRFLHHLFFGAGISIMLPFQAKRTP